MARIICIAAVLLALIAPVAPAAAAEYNTWASPPSTWAFASPAGNLTDEPSGLGASRRNPGHVIWENEAPRNGQGMLYAVSSGGLRKTFRFSPAGTGRPTASMLDFEDMAVGPCNGPGSGTCWWVGDIGHLSNDFSASAKRTFWLYRIPEPDITTTANNTQLTVTGRYPFTVPASIANEGRIAGSASTFDMETLMVHPKSGEIFVVTKGQNTGGKVYILKYPFPLTAGASREAKIVRTVQMPRAGSWNPTTLAGEGYHLVTGGDIHPDGRRFTLRTYGWIWEFRGSDWAAALAATAPVKLPKAGGDLDMQGEAFTYAPDGAKYFTIGEKTRTVTRYVVVFSKK